MIERFTHLRFNRLRLDKLRWPADSTSAATEKGLRDVPLGSSNLGYINLAT